MSSASFIHATLVLPVSDMKRSCDWYARALGFQTIYLHNDPVEDPEGNYAILRRDTADVHLLLDETSRGHSRGHPWATAGTGYMFLTVRGVDEIFRHVAEQGVPITRGIMTEPWGARAFQLTDPSGNLILVAEDTSA